MVAEHLLTRGHGERIRGEPFGTGREDALHAGDHAPDGRRGGVRLFDAFRGPHWTLLTVGRRPELPPVDSDLVHTVHIPPYKPYGTGVFLIRPDGYVGWAGETAEGLAEYWARFGDRRRSASDRAQNASLGT